MPSPTTHTPAGGVPLSRGEPGNDSELVERETSEPAHAAGALEVSADAAPNATLYRARMTLGTRRSADAVRVARAFLNLIVTLTDPNASEEDARVARSTDARGNAVIEVSSRTAGVPASLVVGLTQEVLESHIADRLEHSRSLDGLATLVLGVDVEVSRPADGGVVLRVVLVEDAGSVSDGGASPLAGMEAEPSRHESGNQFRGGASLDVEEALAFTARRS